VAAGRHLLLPRLRRRFPGRAAVFIVVGKGDGFQPVSFATGPNSCLPGNGISKLIFTILSAVTEAERDASGTDSRREGRPAPARVSGDVRKSPLDDMRKGSPADIEGMKDGEAGDNFSFL
jgi:hypothetical protein